MITMAGYVHSFESLAAVDGEGLRCAVFLSGCPLRCQYCHNPDTWDISSGTRTDAKTLVKKIARYKPYFGDTGGVTFSGGEPLLQADFIKELIPLLKDENIGYIIDTSGGVPLSDTVCYVLENSQSVLLDLKFPDSASYKIYTGQDIKNTLATLDFLQSVSKKTIIRTVIVPGINDSIEALSPYIDMIKKYSCVAKYELLPFHTMGFHKYDSLGIENPLKEKSPLDTGLKTQLQEYVNKKIKPTL